MVSVSEEKKNESLAEDMKNCVGGEKESDRWCGGQRFHKDGGERKRRKFSDLSGCNAERLKRYVKPRNDTNPKISMPSTQCHGIYSCEL